MSKFTWIIFFLFIAKLYSNITSGTGEIKFDINKDNVPEILFNNTGLGVGTSTPQTNLHISGNAIMSSLSIGGSYLNSTLTINGTFGITPTTVSSDYTVGSHSLVLVDTSSSNINVTLPSGTTLNGARFYIKKTSTLNELIISSTANIEGTGNVITTISGNLNNFELNSTAATGIY